MSHNITTLAARCDAGGQAHSYTPFLCIRKGPNVRLLGTFGTWIIFYVRSFCLLHLRDSKTDAGALQKIRLRRMC